MQQDEAQPWTIIDVRSVEEFEAGHPAGAWNLPIALAGPVGLQPNRRFVELLRAHFEPDRRLIFSCASGPRSDHACVLLAGSGYRHLANLQGGFKGLHDPFGRSIAPGWKDLGLPAETRARPGRSWRELSDASEPGDRDRAAQSDKGALS